MRERERQAWRDSRGSVLALVPAAVLVLFLLGALTIDSAAAYLAQRQLSDAMAGAANDAATAALSDSAFYQRGQLIVDPTIAATVICQSVYATLDTRIHLTSLQLAVDGRWVHLRATAAIRKIMLNAVPGEPPSSTVRAAAAAVALRSPTDIAPDNPLVWTDVSCDSGQRLRASVPTDVCRTEADSDCGRPAENLLRAGG